MATDLVINLSKNFKKISEIFLKLISRDNFIFLKNLVFNRAERAKFLFKMKHGRDINRLGRERRSEKYLKDAEVVLDQIDLKFLLSNKIILDLISEEEAKKKVIKEINDKMGSEDIRLSICENRTVQSTSGWIFHYDSEKYLETGKKRFMICGNYPVFISKRTQKIYFFYPGVTLESIEEEDRK